MPIQNNDFGDSDESIKSSGVGTHSSDDTASVLTTLLSEEKEADKSTYFLKKYKREKEIATLLNQAYYKSDTGGFRNGFNNFYDEGDTIFASCSSGSKIFKNVDGAINDTGKQYYNIVKSGNRYVAVNIQKTDGGNLIEGTKTYILLDHQGNEKKLLRGYPLYLDGHNVYQVSYEDGGQKYNELYDTNGNLLLGKIPSDHHLLKKEGNTFLFIRNSGKYGEESKYILIKAGESFILNYVTLEDIWTESIVYTYLKELESNKESNAKNREEKEKKYTIKYFEPYRYIQEISDNEGNLVFMPPDELSYILEKEDIVNGVFILQGIRNGNEYAKDIFINPAKNITLNFTKRPSHTFLYGKVVASFLTSNECELYSIEGIKLGECKHHLINENSFQIITSENEKNKLVENSTATVKDQEFDKILRIYHEKDKTIVIVVNNGEKTCIEIQV